jgi:superfamily II DNA or RNA helicase
MKKAILCNRIFLEVDDETRVNLRKELTYKIPPTRRYEPPLTIRNVQSVMKGVISIPSGREDLIPKGYEIVDKRISSPVEFPEFKYTLRDSQQEIYDQINSSAMINATVSFGKTFTALAIAGKLRQKTLVVTHTVALRNQWEREIKKVYGISPCVIGSSRFELDGPIVIGNIQTLYNNIDRIKKEFGTLILDECLDYGTKIHTKEGPKTIGSIVNQKIYTDVLSLNEKTGELEWKPILRHFKNKETHMLKFTFNNGSSLKCTKNHNIYKYNIGKVPAENLKVGDLVTSYLTHKTSHILTEESKPILLGMIMGDGHLRQNGKSCRVSITNGEAQLEYLEYKASILKDAFKADKVTSKSGYKPENNIYCRSTLSFYDLDNWRSQLYSNNSSKNIITKELCSQLSKESWSLMYMDDGSINKKSIIFSFCKLDEDSIKLLKESLTRLFNIETGSFKCKKGFQYITLGTKSSYKFLQQIAHLIPASMRYKFGDFLDLNNIEFTGIKPVQCFKNTSALEITKIEDSTPTRGYRFNIEVQDNHNYFANGKLVSNCHHCSAATFSKVVDRSWATYKIGLSGTVKRKDGKHVVFTDYFSSKIFQPPVENSMEPEIHLHKSEIRLIDGEIPWATKMNKLAYDQDYQHSVALLASYYASKGHKVLVVSDRVEFLISCAELVGSNAISVTGAIKDFEERERLLKQVSSGEYNVLCGTQSIFSEGISLNELSCLIMATPINNEPLLEQLIGRIQRICEGKPTPVVVDINLLGGIAKRQAENRLGFYLRKGWKVSTI